MTEPEDVLAGVGASLSGKVGTVIFSHNRHGPYSYTQPPRTNPSTASQQRVRGWLRQMSQVWALFPPAYRDGWATFAANTRSTNRAATPCRPSGFNRYIGAAVFRFYNQITGGISPPTVFSTARLTPPTYVPFGYLYALIYFSLSDPWRYQGNAGYVVSASRPQPTSVNYFTGPFQFVARIHGHSIVPPILMALNLVYIPDAARPIVFFRARLIESDNRLSVPLITRVSFP